MRARILLPLLIGVVALLSFQTATVPPVASIVIDPAATPITLHWKDDSGRVFGEHWKGSRPFWNATASACASP